MKPEQYYKYGLLAFVVMAILFVCAAAYERLSHSGMGTTAVWLSLIAGALLLGGIYLLLSGMIFDFYSCLMRRCGKIKPEKVVTPSAELATPTVPEVTPVSHRPNRSKTAGCSKMPSIRSADTPILFSAMHSAQKKGHAKSVFSIVQKSILD